MPTMRQRNRVRYMCCGILEIGIGMTEKLITYKAETVEVPRGFEVQIPFLSSCRHCRVFKYDNYVSQGLHNVYFKG